MTFFVVIIGLGEAAGADTLAKATFIFPMSNLAGTFSLLPGGLGPANASITGLSQGLLSLARSDAVAAAVFTRGMILGLPVVSGLAAMLTPTIRRPTSPAMADFGSDT